MNVVIDFRGNQVGNALVSLMMMMMMMFIFLFAAQSATEQISKMFFSGLAWKFGGRVRTR